MRHISIIVLLLGATLGSASCRTGTANSGPAGVSDRNAGDRSFALVASGWSFGFCLTACVGDLSFDGDRVRYTIRDRGPDTPLRLDNAGVLTRQGRQELDAALAALRNVPLQERYGCPDCADGGASYVTFSRDGILSSHVYEFGNPPPALRRLDTLVEGLKDALETCRTTARIAVEPGCVARRR